MSLRDATLLSGATMAPTGGSTLTFGAKGSELNKVNLYVPADTDLRLRREIACTTKDPKVSTSAPNGYTQARASAQLKSPLLLDNGAITVNTVTIQVSFDVETTDAEKDELLVLGSQMLNDADFLALFKDLSTE